MPSPSPSALQSLTLRSVMRNLPRTCSYQLLTSMPASVNSSTAGLPFGRLGAGERRPDACAVGVLVLPAGGKSACAGSEGRRDRDAWSLVLPWRPKKGSAADGSAPGPGVCCGSCPCVSSPLSARTPRAAAVLAL